MACLAHSSLLALTVASMIAVGLATDDPQTDLVGEGCSPHMYVSSTAFTKNLNSVLQSLLSNLSSDGFVTSMQSNAGKTNPVYGLATCRKYLSARECSQCMDKAATQAKAVCPQSNGARIHLDGCLLRYENNSFYGQEVDAGNYVYCASPNDSNPQAFLQRAPDLSTQLITNATKNNGYAVGSIDGSLYGLAHAQCWPSLTNISCKRCCIEAQNQLLTISITGGDNRDILTCLKPLPLCPVPVISLPSDFIAALMYFRSLVDVV